MLPTGLREPEALLIVTGEALKRLDEIRDVLRVEGGVIIREKTVQGSNQIPGIGSDPDTAFQIAGIPLEKLLGVVLTELSTISSSSDYYIAPTAEEAAASLNILFSSQQLEQSCDSAPMNSNSQRKFIYEPEQDAANHVRVISTDTVGSVTAKSNSFQARAIPATHARPSITPRTTKSAALRMGMAIPDQDRIKSPEPLQPSKRVLESLPRSLAQPVLAPRATKASSLRSGDATETKSKPLLVRETSGTSERSNHAVFRNVPGHRRIGTVEVESTLSPKVEPRQNRSALLRAGAENVDPTSSVPRQAHGTSDRASRYDDVPGYRRRSLQVSVPSTQAPSITPRMTKAALLRTGKPGASTTPVRTDSFLEQDDEEILGERLPGTDSPLAGKQQKRPESALSRQSLNGMEPAKVERKVRPPSIVPRLNKSAALRAQGPKV